MIQGWGAQGARIAVYVAGAGLVFAGSHVAFRASAATPPAACVVKTGSPVKVAEVLGGGALRLADGRKVLLSGIDAPRRGAKDSAAPFAAESQSALERMVLGRSVTIGDAGQPSKSGWLRAQVFAGAGTWVQGELIAGGYARVRTFPDRRECSGELLAREAKARMAKKGLWALAAYAVSNPETVDAAKGGFRVVEGVVASTANIGGRLFLNFGEDFRTDFTVHIKPDNVKLFAQSGMDLEALEGKRIRVRGLVRERNGPVIDAAIPEQIELLR